MAKFTPVVTKDLQETVRKNQNIKAVYFDDKGNHYFNKHEIEVHEDDGNGFSKGAKKVTALPGVKQGVLKVKIGTAIKDKKVNTEYNAVACEMDRDEILDAEIEEAVDPSVELANIKKELADLKKEKAGKEKAGKEKAGKEKDKD